MAARNEFGVGYQAGLDLASAMTFSLLAVRHMARLTWRGGAAAACDGDSAFPAMKVLSF